MPGRARWVSGERGGLSGGSGGVRGAVDGEGGGAGERNAMQVAPTILYSII